MLIWDGFGLQSTHSGIGRHALELAIELEGKGRGPTILPSVSRLDPAFARWQADFLPFPLGRAKSLSLLASGLQARALANRAQSLGKPIYHGLSNYNLPSLPTRFQTVLTIHDLIPLTFPEGVSKRLHKYLLQQLPIALGRADVIICVSEWSACSVKNQFPHAKDKVLVIPNGKSPMSPRNQRSPEAKIRLLSISRGEVYKRLTLIPEILSRLSQNYEWHHVTDVPGRALIRDFASIQIHTNVSDEVLESLWRGTDIFVHPSLWEGYCLPAAAALSFGIPSVFTGGSGLDEVAGMAGIRMRTTDEADLWADAIVDLQSRHEEFENLAKEQWEKLLSWSDVAKKFIEVYDSLGG